MKTRESGMPDEQMWASFFDPSGIAERLGLSGCEGDVVEFGCGYGTFTVAAAKMVKGMVYALDIDSSSVQATRIKVEAEGLHNVRVVERDFIEDGTGLPDGSVRYAMLFNILHCENPVALLEEAHRVLVPGGSVGIIHWNYDASTPRGPSMEIRPTCGECIAWALSAGFRSGEYGVIDFPPYHFGLLMRKV